ncbi:MAG: hypothetical protein U1F77_03070 [Kiritimatiellia bacterium]
MAVAPGGFVLDEQAAADEESTSPRRHGGPDLPGGPGQCCATFTTLGGGYFLYDGVKGHAPDDKGLRQQLDQVPPAEVDGEAHLEFAGGFTIADGFARVGLDAGYTLEFFGECGVPGRSPATTPPRPAWFWARPRIGLLEFEYAWRSSVEKDARVRHLLRFGLRRQRLRPILKGQVHACEELPARGHALPVREAAEQGGGPARAARLRRQF